MHLMKMGSKLGCYRNSSFFFHMLGNDILEMVEQTRIEGYVPDDIISTFISVIPKCDKPGRFSDYRPI